MAQKKWVTDVANEMQGSTSNDRALLDIIRTVRDNLYHEGIGIYMSATPKLLEGGSDIRDVGRVAFDRIKNLEWRDYVPIAKNREQSIVPHVGNVDTVSFPLDQIWYNSIELEETDLASMRRGGIYRARMAARIVKTYAAAMDIEFFDLLVAIACGHKDSVCETDIYSSPEQKTGNRRAYRIIADTTSEMEQKTSKYNIGATRNRFNLYLSFQWYTEIVDETPGQAMAIDRLLGWLQNESIQPAQISNVKLFRHPFLNNDVSDVKGPSKAIPNYKGIHGIMALDGATAIIPIFYKSEVMPNADRGNWRAIIRSKWGKGTIFGDYVRVFKDPSTPDNPLPFEKHLVENAAYYNSRFAFNDEDEDIRIVIPDTIEGLRKNYRTSQKDLPAPDAPDKDHSPENWAQRTYTDLTLIWNSAKDAIEIGNSLCYKAGEDWALNEGGIENYKNWFEFTQQFGEKKDRPISLKKLVIWDTTSWGYRYCVPVYWTLTSNIKKLKPKAKSKLINV